MPGMLRDSKAAREVVGTEDVAPILAQFLKRACLALDRDALTARQEIQGALELLSNAPVETEVQPGHHHGRRCGLAPWQVRRVTQHINANLEAPIRVEDMATLTRLSTSYFFRAFKRSFGKAPHAYFIALRIARARELLVKSDEKICAIAMTCGFADQAHFSRVFRREMGSAPGVWRREQRGLLIRDPIACDPDAADLED